MRENDMKFSYEKGTLRETIKLVGSSIDGKVYIRRLRKTMLRISYAHIVSLYHIILVIRSLFRSFQSYSNKFFLHILDSIVVIETILTCELHIMN